MKNILLNISITVLSVSCTLKDPITVKQIVSDEMVTIFVNAKQSMANDSIAITIPTEFEITINSSTVKSLDLNYIINKRRLTDHIFDYQVYNKQNKTKPIYTLKPYLSTDKPINIIIKQRDYLVSKKDANELLKKYNIKQSLDNLKFGDTIKLAPFNQIIKENKRLKNELNKVNDSIFFTIITADKGKSLMIKEKINW